MKLDQLELGDVFSYGDSTYMVSYIGCYGITTFILNTGYIRSFTFFTAATCTLLYKTTVRSDTDVKLHYPEFFV